MHGSNCYDDENDDTDTYHNALTHIPNLSPSNSTETMEHISNDGEKISSVSSYWKVAKNWMNSQRDRGKTEALQREVERQRRILLEETMKMHQRHSNDDDCKGSLDSNSAYQSVTQANGLNTANILDFSGICSGIYDSDQDNDYLIEDGSNEQGHDKYMDGDDVYLPANEQEDEFLIGSPQYTQTGGLKVELKFLENGRRKDLCNKQKVQIEAETGCDYQIPFIMTPEQMANVASSGLPASLMFAKWTRLYCLQRDGDSFGGTFLRKVEKHERTLLVVQTTRGEIMGAYSNSKWENQGGSVGASFYGSALSCLFSLNNDTQEIMVYKWTGKNRYIQVCDVYSKLIAFGGGGKDGEFGLCIEDDFRRGSTGPCETFDNPPLCEQDRFEIMNFEAWGFTVGLL